MTDVFRCFTPSETLSLSMLVYFDLTFQLTALISLHLCIFAAFPYICEVVLFMTGFEMLKVYIDSMD